LDSLFLLFLILKKKSIIYHLMAIMQKNIILTQKLVIFLLFILIIPRIATADDFYFIDWLTGDSIGDQFFHIANGHGDVNGDGYEDILIGGSGTGGPDGDSCYAKLFYGGPGLDTIPDLIFQPDTTNYFGSSCAFIRDVNVDGYDDILIGDPDRSIFYWGNGAAYLYFGGAEMDTVPDMFFQGEYFYHGLGANVSGAGDINGDGYDDWLINAPYYDYFAFGRIYLYYGGPDLDDTCDVYFEGGIGDGLQFDNPQLGDINDDGYDDLIFWNWGYGSVNIYFGSSDMDTVPDLLWLDFYHNLPVSGVGDVNDDGYNDWMIDCPNGLSLFFGSEHPDTIPDLIFEPEPPYSGFYSHVCGGDIDGDEIDDIFIGGGDINNPTYGAVIGFLGSDNIDNDYDYFISSGMNDEILGFTVGSTDINGDGIFEVLAGAGQYSGGPVYWGPGRVWILTTHDNWQAVINIITETETYTILKCFPNPFNETITIRFNLLKEEQVKLIIYDIQGREAAKLIDGINIAGSHEVVFDGKDLASGIYFARLSAGEFSHTKKMVLMK